MIKCRSKGLLFNHDGTVWPCCWTLTCKNESKDLKNADKDWNNLLVHDLDTILNHELFTTHFNFAHWNDKTKCDKICTRWCTVKK